eukprot:g21433.t1
MKKSGQVWEKTQQLERDVPHCAVRQAQVHSAVRQANGGRAETGGVRGRGQAQVARLLQREHPLFPPLRTPSFVQLPTLPASQTQSIPRTPHHHPLSVACATEEKCFRWALCPGIFSDLTGTRGRCKQTTREHKGM